MTSRAEHYRAAEELLTMAEGLPDERAAFHLAKAQIHATLAQTPNEVFNAMLDMESEAALKEREEQWAKDWPPPKDEGL